MDISTGNWFNYVRDNVLTEGLRDIGLPEFVIDYLEDAMPDASEKAKVYIANHWKKSRGQMADAATIPALQYEVVTFLMDNMFRDDVISDKPEGRERLNPVARTVTPYYTGGVDGKPVVRKAYDEEKIEQNKKVAFVITNIRNALDKPQGAWRKAFMKAVKALSKAGLPSEKVESLKEYLRSLAGKNFHFWLNGYSELVAFLNDDATNYELIKGEEDIYEAQKIAIEYLNNKEDPENILHTFDDGSYWYNLNVSSCDVEASRMGHCGSDSRGTLVSLRKKLHKRRESSSYVTMTYSEYENTIYQIKGRSNDAPDEKTWDHIAWFINNYDVTSVEETGEHSGDQEGIQEMIEYLASETNANFHGSIEDRLEKAEDYCAGQIERYTDNRDELEHGDVGYNLEEEMNDIYCYASARYEFEIDLGWTGYSATDTGYIADNPQDFEEIPRGYSGMREFASELDIDDMMYEMPGDDGDWDISLRNLVGVQPDDVPAGSERPTTHLVISLYSNETLSVDEDGDVPEFDEFVDGMLEFEEDTAPSYKEQIRQNLAAGGYMAKSAYDRSREEMMKLTHLDKWHVKQAQGGLEFDWTADDGQPLHTYTGKFDSARAQMYGTGTGNRMGVNPDAVFAEVFGYGPRFSFANMRGTNDYSVQFARELSSAITAHLKSKANAPGQQKLDFGDKYAGADPMMFLADDTDFVIFQDVNYRPDGNRERYPLIKIKWLYRMRVNPQSPPEEFEIIQEIAAFLNENEELVTAAADKIIAMALEGHSEKINKRRDKIMDNYQLQIQINNAKKIYGDVLDQYGDEEGYGSTAEIARKVYTIITWFEDNYADMGEAERYIMATKFIIPMLQNNFRSYSEMGEIDRNTGRPVMFDELVPHQVAKMGGQPVNMVTRNESIEDQISRIDQMLTEQVDIRLYKMQLDAVVSSERATGAKKLLTDELRSIEGVTVISVEDSRDLATGADFTRFNIKFSLKGQTPRVEFINKRLLPSLRRVDGFEVKDWSPPIEITPGKKLSELALPFGGVAGALGAVRYGTGPVRTPSVSVQQVADDWATNGVMDYDRPMANADMQYHEMVDASELFPYMSKVYRNPKDAFDADYHHFIKNGPQAPVYVAVGKNGRIKITGNEDLVWFAKKSGLEQIPVFFSYQLQV
tara:strand:- start:1145 stop:4594 length:3450 start_codon:yes stop_codon:yes gene_type:complete